jgi:microcystin degradation protein MlrC
MAKRVLVGGIWHETNSFSPVKTDLDAFRRYLFLEGEAVITGSKGTNTEVGGMIAAAPEAGLELIPSIYIGAAPSGMVSREVIDLLLDRLKADIEASGALDGVLLALHGAMVAEGIDQADAYVVQAVRDIVGLDMPLVCTIDFHANVEQALVDPADVLIAYKTLPHVDMGARGEDAVRIIAGLIDSGRKPHKVFRKLPIITVPQRQPTHESPMREIMAELAEVERSPDLVTASVIGAFAYCDVPQLGMAILTYGEAAAAEAAADRLADAVWSRRAEFKPDLVLPEEAVRRAIAANAGPIFLVEPADNIGGGAPGDGTHLLKALLEGRAREAATVIWDPGAAAAAAAVGVGKRFKGKVGGKTLALHGDPVEIEGTVIFAAPVSYRRDSTWMTGQPADLGIVATVDTGGIKVILTSERAIPFDTLHLRIPGVEPERAKMVTAKCASAWSGIFGEMAEGHVYVDTPGVCSSNVERMPYTRLERAFYPLDLDVQYP